MKIVNQHFTPTDNIGDFASAPAIYFANLFDEEVGWDWRPTEDCFVVFGGGGMIAKPEEAIMNEVLDSPFVKGSAFFGAGHNHEDMRFLGCWSKIVKRVDLAGLRDKKEYLPPVADFVPCASCMHPVFDKTFKKFPDSSTVLYSHKDRPLGHLFNEEYHECINIGDSHQDLIQNISFISSARYVITNTYHGAYWSMLMGKKVILYDLWSTRFAGLPIGLPVIHHPNQLADAKKVAKRAPAGMIVRHREIVKKFAIKLAKQIDTSYHL